jgi:hypothetical protein
VPTTVISPKSFINLISQVFNYQHYIARSAPNAPKTPNPPKLSICAKYAKRVKCDRVIWKPVVADSIIVLRSRFKEFVCKIFYVLFFIINQDCMGLKKTKRARHPIQLMT